MSKNTNLSQVKEWVTFAIAIVAAIASIIFWVQSADNDRIERIEGEVKELKHDMKEITKQNSGNIVSTVNKKLNFLVLGEKPTNKKVELAKKIGVKILNQQEWAKLLN